MAPIRAKENDSAIGRNILPSTPESERIGMNTIKIMICPKMADFIIILELSMVISSLTWFSSIPFNPAKRFLFTANWWTVNSTMITAPSMMIPKSIAPRLIRFADKPKMYIMLMPNSRLIGITDATISPDRRLPSSNTTTKITIRAPRVRFSTTVAVVLPISSDRSRNGLMYTPSGKVFCICATRSFMALITRF